MSDSSSSSNDNNKPNELNSIAQSNAALLSQIPDGGKQARKGYLDDNQISNLVSNWWQRKEYGERRLTPEESWKMNEYGETDASYRMPPSSVYLPARTRLWNAITDHPIVTVGLIMTVYSFLGGMSDFGSSAPRERLQARYMKRRLQWQGFTVGALVCGYFFDKKVATLWNNSGDSGNNSGNNPGSSQEKKQLEQFK